MSERWEEWLAGLRQGQPEAVADFWQQFGEPLLRLADQNLQHRLRRRVDPEDLVQSAVRTFLRRLHGGQFQLDDGEDLWGLLCAITLNKTRQQARFHGRQKRGLNREQPLGGQPTQTESHGGWEPADDGPSPEDAVVLVDLVERLLDSSADEEERQVAQLRLEDLTCDEIAARLGCSERTVRRLLQRIRGRLGRMLAS